MGLLGNVTDPAGLAAALADVYGNDPYTALPENFTDVIGAFGLTEYDLIQLFDADYEANTDTGFSSDWRQNFNRLLFDWRYADYGYGQHRTVNGIDYTKYAPKLWAYILQKRPETVQAPVDNTDKGTFFVVDRNRQPFAGQYMTDGLHINGRDYNLATGVSFDEMDSDGNGKLEREEFGSASAAGYILTPSRIGAEKTFDILDTAGLDEVIDRDEFASALAGGYILKEGSYRLIERLNYKA
ncbi:hypothetical protein ACFL3N_02855, partial [Candidatus Omnitrophota bacterium]